MSGARIALKADDVEVLSSSCPTRFSGHDVASGDEVGIRYSGWALSVERNGVEVFTGEVPDGRGGEWCTLEEACAAAGIDLLVEGEEPPITLRRSEVEERCGGCPMIFRAEDLSGGREVELHYRGGTLTVTRGSTETYVGPIPGSRGDGVCTLEEACRAAGIRLVD